jgi:hypothetical protein
MHDIAQICMCYSERCHDIEMSLRCMMNITGMSF